MNTATNNRQVDDNEAVPVLHTGTYSPEDNKLRLYPASRLDEATYERVKAHGFSWAAKQGLFVAPMWTPQREDLLIELCGGIDAEEMTVAERAEARAERFSDYKTKRAHEAHEAHEAVSRIAGNIPFGQPVLVGHHSEARARRDQKRMERGMRKAVNLWETAQHWQDRAAAALAHANYKARRDVIARRIKGIESDARKQTKCMEESNRMLVLWRNPTLMTRKDGEPMTLRQSVIALANMDGGLYLNNYKRPSGYTGSITLWEAAGGNIDNLDPETKAIATPEEICAKAIQRHEATIAWSTRWLNHFNNRLAYERALLAEKGGLVSDKFDIQVGGRVLIGREWQTVMRCNVRDGKLLSVTTNSRYGRVQQVEEIADYQPPTNEQAAAVNAATTVGKLCNYPGPDFIPITQATWDSLSKRFKCYGRLPAKEGIDAHRVRKVFGKMVLPASVTDDNKRYDYLPVFVTDAKRIDPPSMGGDVSVPKIAPPTREVSLLPSARVRPERTLFDDMKDSLKSGGVQVAVVDQLLPTPNALADRMVMEGGIEPGKRQRLLDPSAGTGVLLKKMCEAGGVATGVEINAALCERLRNVLHFDDIREGDFMTCTVPQLGLFDVILMNPPFKNAIDIEHIKHAYSFLNETGRLVAICANGPRQNDILRPWVESLGGTWEPLPDDTFVESGTSVRTVLLVVSR